MTKEEIEDKIRGHKKTIEEIKKSFGKPEWYIAIEQKQIDICELALDGLNWRDFKRMQTIGIPVKLPECPCCMMRWVPSMGELKAGHHPNCPGSWSKADNE